MDRDYNSTHSDYFDSLSSDDSYDFDSYWGATSDIDCDDIQRTVYVGTTDQNNLDRDADGVGCEDWS